jgi:uncharacterized protein (DUF488 family)
MMAPVLFTIGYEGRSPNDFVATLSRAGIDVLIDVRQAARSRRPGFGKTALARRLSWSGIEYVHAAFAGNPAWLRHEARSAAECLAWYELYLRECPEIEAAFAAMVRGYMEAELRVCVMCFEEDPADCHRGVLARRWRRRTGGRVRHLAPP